MSEKDIFNDTPSEQDRPESERARSPFIRLPDDEAQNQAATFSTNPRVEEADASPFKRVASSDNDLDGTIPKPRPEGQSSALARGANTDPRVVLDQTEKKENIFQAASENEARSEKGFPQQGLGEQTAAASLGFVEESSPFIESNNSNHADFSQGGSQPQQGFSSSLPTEAQHAFPPDHSRQQVTQLDPVPAPLQTNTDQVSTESPPLRQQFELRAIFGVAEHLNKEQILELVKSLPGVLNVAVVGSQESAALSNFRQAMQGMGFGNSNNFKLIADGSPVDFLTEGGTTVAVIHEGSYGPGVQETLIIATREIGKLA